MKKSLLATVAGAALVLGAWSAPALAQSATDETPRTDVQTTPVDPSDNTPTTGATTGSSSTTATTPADTRGAAGPTTSETGTSPGGTAAESEGSATVPGGTSATGGTTSGTTAAGTPAADTAAAPLPADAMTATGYANMAAVGDMYEIEAGKLALAESKSDEVRKLAQMIVDDHTQSSTEMKSIVQGMNGSLPQELDAKHQGMIQTLKDADDAQFDNIFLRQQVTAHQEALALHQGYAQNGDNDQLKAFAANVAPKIQAHLEHAQKLQNQVTDGTAAR